LLALGVLVVPGCGLHREYSYKLPPFGTFAFSKASDGSVTATLPDDYDGTVTHITVLVAKTDEVVWGATSVGQPKHLKSFTLGTAPPGFVDTGPHPLQLTATVYKVIAIGEEGSKYLGASAGCLNYAGLGGDTPQPGRPDCFIRRRK
jgi:hypothetical protein